ncbi:hypothetical protein IW16_23070 [Chryseobacterium vrystaatense]|uniref:Lipoprotein n=2 Tax=Chryseobacterium vrystaatense TaxID=307480 RepID=A0ABR4UGX0_9FLAO|nr:hypothetical protein IW16_23070 [Chryseobacterium vrystaatense]
MKHYYLKFTLIIGCLILWDCDKTTETVKHFDDYEFNTSIAGNGSFNIGHRFTINKEDYIEDQYDFVYYTKDLEERKFLIPGSLQNDHFPVYWREVHLPFKIIKKVKGDTLILIKNNKKIIFKRIKD